MATHFQAEAFTAHPRFYIELPHINTSSNDYNLLETNFHVISWYHAIQLHVSVLIHSTSVLIN
jgi:hypothetical protein